MRYIIEEKGSALLLALILMVMLTLVFVAAITTSVTDMDISENIKEKTSSFYVAEAGLEYGMGVLKSNPNMLNNDTLEMLINGSPALGGGTYNIDIAGAIPYKTLTSTGNAEEGESQVQVIVKRTRNPLNIWNNITFAGVGQAGKAIAGNVRFHGPVHIMGEGEPFTDANGNGQWDDADNYTDLNGDGNWDMGEPLTKDLDGDGQWDDAETYSDVNGSGSYDGMLTVVDLAYDISGAAGVFNNYTGIPSELSSRVPALDTTTFNGEVVSYMEAEFRVKHGQVSVSGTATIGQSNESGDSDKETMDGCYVNDGYTGNKGASNVYSDNGTSQTYDLEDDLQMPYLSEPYTDPNTGYTYSSYMDYLSTHALVINGDITLQPGVEFPAQSNANGSIYMDGNGNLQISGIVYIDGNININAGSGTMSHNPVLFDGMGTLVATQDISVNTHVLSEGMFPTDDVIGFIARHDINIGTGPGDAQLNLMGAFYAQETIYNSKQNGVAGALVSNYFDITNVPDLYWVPSIVDNLPPGMPGGGTVYTYTYKIVNNSWREL
ncbi:MAG: pilus assembly PilX N-terminal domain-containing protein [candidate division Zixibacteria bacterium]|nr:pilus assembly PilX N-terminal domain-containing protein [candidate division Zixibacteria bacterium]